MKTTFEEFWKLRSSGRLSDARALLLKLEESATDHDRAEIELMKNSFLRADHGGLAAETRLAELDAEGLFQDRKGFQYFYQKACNSLVQGHASMALENLLQAGPGENQWTRMMGLTARLICLDNLGFPLEDLRIEAAKELDACTDMDLKAAATPAYLSIVVRNDFREGRLSQLLAADAGPSWSQISYFQSWAASLPAFDFSTLSPNPVHLIQESLQQLTSNADFYLRSYRLQTLVGRVYVAPQDTPTSWGERSDRLYLWTWRWLLDPTPQRAEALAMILTEFDQWDGHDVLNAMDCELVRLAMGWIALFEPRVRTRWASLLRRVSTHDHPPFALFSLEELWLSKAKALLAGNERGANEAQKQINAHPLSANPRFAFHRIEGQIPKAGKKSQGLVIDAESGKIRLKNGKSIRSLPIARLLQTLSSEGRLSFEQALFICFEIDGFDPVIHDPKIQNIVNRARPLLGSAKALRTKDRWIFLEEDLAAPLSFRVTRAGLPLSTPASSRKKSERLRNERSLSVLLKKAQEIQGRWVSRKELEDALEIPKSTLNRYLQTWLRRKWLSRQGTGRNIRYQMTFFDS